MGSKNPIKRIVCICVISGLISGIVANLLFWLVFASAWFFFIIPATIGWSIDHFANIPRHHLLDEDRFEKLKKQTAWTCAVMVLLFVLLAVLPIFLLIPLSYQWMNAIFYVACGVSVYVGYSRGRRCIIDAYYGSVEDELENPA